MNRKSKEKFQFETVENITEEGTYMGKIMEVTDKGNSYELKIRLYDPDDVTKAYESVRGWIPKENRKDGITAHFLEAFDDPESFADVIGKSVEVEVESNSDSDGNEFFNVVDFVV